MYLLKRDISKKALTRLYNQLRGYGVRIRDIDCSKSQKSSAMKEEILSQLREMCQTIEREKKICEDITEADARRVFNYQVSQYLNKKEKGLTESDIFLLIEQNKELSEDYPNPTPKFMEMQNELFNCLFERFKVSD